MGERDVNTRGRRGNAGTNSLLFPLVTFSAVSYGSSVYPPQIDPLLLPQNCLVCLCTLAREWNIGNTNSPFWPADTPVHHSKPNAFRCPNHEPTGYQSAEPIWYHFLCPGLSESPSVVLISATPSIIFSTGLPVCQVDRENQREGDADRNKASVLTLRGIYYKHKHMQNI